jgi:hypothetical protein
MVDLSGHTRSTKVFRCDGKKNNNKFDYQIFTYGKSRIYFISSLQLTRFNI